MRYVSPATLRNCDKTGSCWEPSRRRFCASTGGTSLFASPSIDSRIVRATKNIAKTTEELNMGDEEGKKVEKISITDIPSLDHVLDELSDAISNHGSLITGKEVVIRKQDTAISKKMKDLAAEQRTLDDMIRDGQDEK